MKKILIIECEWCGEDLTTSSLNKCFICGHSTTKKYEQEIQREKYEN